MLIFILKQSGPLCKVGIYHIDTYTQNALFEKQDFKLNLKEIG